MAKRRSWTRDELLLAFNLYCKIPFGQFHQRNAHVIEIAELINRTPSAVAMKLSNFASLDPHHQARGISGLGNASRADREAWDEFTADWSKFVEESELKLEQFTSKTSSELVNEDGLSYPNGPTEAQATVTVRRGQRFFRNTILANYRSVCCICGISIPALLIASHIIRWADDENLRLNPSNGLCLCALHDRGFDQGLITVSQNYRVIVGSEIKEYLPQEALESGFVAYNNHEISLPDKFLPSKEFLSVHNQICFRH